MREMKKFIDWEGGKMKIYNIAAFADNKNGGNLAGVVLDSDSFTREEMQNIAKKIGYSETAFVMKSDKADFRVRFFTPVDEVDLCGHATIATYNLLRDLDYIKKGDYLQETKAGILKIKVYEDNVYMEQNIPKFMDIVEKKEIIDCFDKMNFDYIGESPAQVVSTGLKDIIFSVRDLKTLWALEPNYEKMIELSEKYDVVGIHVFCTETIEGNTAHARDFAPRYGIKEESATGTANGALACYMLKYLDYNRRNFVIEQGDCMKTPSRIYVELKNHGIEIEEVYVGGKAVIVD